MKQTRNGGFLHRLNSERRSLPNLRTVTLPERMASRNDLPSLAEQYRAAIHPAHLQCLANTLRLSAASLQRLGIGWAFDSGAWAFPMTNAASKVLGIRLRLPSGRKIAVTGGREGLFIPADLPQGGELLITEGPTDCAALLDLGFAAVGRPCCAGGVRLLVELVKARKPLDVVIVADADEPGQRGADALASVLVLYVPRLRIITPPNGIKDARAWKQAGVTAAVLRTSIDAAPIRRLRISRKQQARRGSP